MEPLSFACRMHMMDQCNSGKSLARKFLYLVFLHSLTNFLRPLRAKLNMQVPILGNVINVGMSWKSVFS